MSRAVGEKSKKESEDVFRDGGVGLCFWILLFDHVSDNVMLISLSLNESLLFS